MALEDYSKAYKLGKKDYQHRMMHGMQPTLKVLDENTVKYMVEEMKQELEEKDREIQEKNRKIEELLAKLAGKEER